MLSFGLTLLLYPLPRSLIIIHSLLQSGPLQHSFLDWVSPETRRQLNNFYLQNRQRLRKLRRNMQLSYPWNVVFHLAYTSTCSTPTQEGRSGAIRILRMLCNDKKDFIHYCWHQGGRRCNFLNPSIASRDSGGVVAQHPRISRRRPHDQVKV